MTKISQNSMSLHPTILLNKVFIGILIHGIMCCSYLVIILIVAISLRLILI